MSDRPLDETIHRVPPDRIDPNPYQPRRHADEAGIQELAASIREHGFLQPLVVRPRGGRFELIAGERRLRAARLLGLAEVPVVVRECADEQALEVALVENLQREDLGVVEEARAYQRLVEEFHYTHGEIARRTGKSRVAVTNTLRLLHLAPPVLDMLERGELTEGHARALLALDSPDLQQEIARWVVRTAASVRRTEQKVRELAAAPGERSAPATEPERPNPHLQAIEDQLRRHFGTRVSLTYRDGRGALLMEFYSDDDLWRLLDLMGIEPEF